MKIILIGFLLLPHLSYADKAVINDLLKGDYEENFMAFIQQQKNALNIPLELGYKTIKQRFGNGISGIL